MIIYKQCYDSDLTMSKYIKWGFFLPLKGKKLGGLNESFSLADFVAFTGIICCVYNKQIVILLHKQKAKVWNKVSVIRVTVWF